MPSVTVAINGRDYTIACDEGQEPQLKRLGAYIDKRSRELVASVGQVSESMLLVMVALLVADELSDAYEELRGSSDGGVSLREERQHVDEALASALGGLAKRLEAIAQTLDDA